MAPMNTVCMISYANSPPNRRPGIDRVAREQSSTIAEHVIVGCNPRRRRDLADGQSGPFSATSRRLVSRSSLHVCQDIIILSRHNNNMSRHYHDSYRCECLVQLLNTERPRLGPLPIPHARCRLQPKNLYRSFVSSSTRVKTGYKCHLCSRPFSSARIQVNPLSELASRTLRIDPIHR